VLSNLSENLENQITLVEEGACGTLALTSSSATWATSAT
jgi:hypothetical protein